MGLTNEEASGQEKKPLPPEEKVWLSGPARRETVCSWQERSPVREIVAFVPIIEDCVCETFLVGEGILSPGISNLASKASEWLSTAEGSADGRGRGWSGLQSFGGQVW